MGDIITTAPARARTSASESWARLREDGRREIEGLLSTEDLRRLKRGREIPFRALEALPRTTATAGVIRDQMDARLARPGMFYREREGSGWRSYLDPTTIRTDLTPHELSAVSAAASVIDHGSGGGPQIRARARTLQTLAARERELLRELQQIAEIADQISEEVTVEEDLRDARAQIDLGELVDHYRELLKAETPAADLDRAARAHSEFLVDCYGDELPVQITWGDEIYAEGAAEDLQLLRRKLSAHLELFRRARGVLS